MNGMTSIENVGLGWQPIVKEAVAKIEQLGGRIVQIKEKFGGLRIYYVPTTDSSSIWAQIDEIVTEAANRYDQICEKCGDAGVRIDLKGWLKTRCKKHSKLDE
jgi:hypothetical protein